MSVGNSETTILIEADHLVIGYARPLLPPIDVAIREREFWGILGPNGSGKTTLIKTLMAILNPLGGSIRRKPSLRIGYVPQKSQLDSIFPLTVKEVVSMGRYPFLKHGVLLSKSDRELVHQHINLVGMSKYEKSLFRDLSGGQKQRALMARALAAEPDLLVLDEPTDGMDVAAEANTLELVLRHHEQSNFSVITVSHDLNLISRHASTLIMLDSVKNQIHVGSVKTILTTDILKSIYGIEFETHERNGHSFFFAAAGGMKIE